MLTCTSTFSCHSLALNGSLCVGRGSRRRRVAVFAEAAEGTAGDAAVSASAVASQEEVRADRLP